MVNSETSADFYFMQLALDEAEIAYTNNEVPIGAVLVLSIGTFWRRISTPR